MIDVVWCFGCRGFWDHGMIMEAVEGKLWKTLYPYKYREWIHKTEWPIATDLFSGGAVVVVPGGVFRDRVDEIRSHISSFKWKLLLILSDEENAFDWTSLIDNSTIVWVQTPRPGMVRPRADRYILFGYPYETKIFLSKIGSLPPINERQHLWCFAGQTQHWQRLQFINSIHPFMHLGKAMISSGFSMGVDKETFLRLYLNSKLAPCPSGNVTPDCFRIWESLECGCLPIVNRFGPSQTPEYDYWKHVLGESSVPFPVIDQWDQGVGVISRLSENVSELERMTNLSVAWWNDYKMKFMLNFENDIEQLSGVRRPENV
jgi:hypothetical protein